MDELLAKLTELGFGEYEARAYVALLRHNPINGYELARLSGIPRGNIYSVLSRLEEKGAVVRLDLAEGTRYGPVPATEVLAGLAARFEATLGEARRQLSQVAAPMESQPVWNAAGYDSLLDHARRLVDGARENLLVAVWPQESATLAAETQTATARGVEIKTLCLAACKEECGYCRGQVYRHDVLPGQNTRRLVIVPDGEEVLAGEIQAGTSGSPAENTHLVRTRQPLLVDLAAGFVRNSIALVLVLKDLAPELRDHLSTETRKKLAMLGPTGEGSAWPAEIQRLLTSVSPGTGAAGESSSHRHGEPNT